MDKKPRTPQDQSRLNAHRTSGQQFHDGEVDKATATSGTQFVRDEKGQAWAYNPKFDKTFRVLDDGTQVQGKKGNHLPGANSVDNYIDNVLEKSGMTEPTNIPIPQPRPQQMDPNAASGKADSMDLGSETLADVPPEEIDKALQEGWTTAEIAAAVAAGGVAGWLAKRGMTKPNGPEAAAMAGITPDSTKAQSANAAPEQQPRLTGLEDTRTLDQRAQEMIEQTSPSDQDNELSRIMGEEETTSRPSTQSRMQPATDDMLNQMAAMPQEQWTQFAAENGIALDAQTMQALAQRQQLIQQMIEKSAGRATGKAVRTGM